jgi:hypothetical protein
MKITVDFARASWAMALPIGTIPQDPSPARMTLEDQSIAKRMKEEA